MDYSLPELLEILAGGEGLALAVIVEAGGSTPQVPGAKAVFSPAGLVAGTVGGGLLEAKVEAVARTALADGQARLLAFRLDADPSDLEGAVCGGSARVLVDPGAGRDRGIFAAALGSIRTQGWGYLATGMAGLSDDRVSVERAWVPIEGPEARTGGRTPDLPLGFHEADLRAPFTERPGHYLFVEALHPLPRLIIAGAGHVGRAVARLGRLLDFSVTVIDDRAEFANAANVPGADTIVLGDIGESLRSAGETGDDYFVIVTRGHRKDAEALRAVIGRPAAYVGMIGSKTKIDIVRREFLSNGWAAAEEWERISAPIGLDIGSRTVDEIAVSIAAELVLVRARRTKARAG